jgi:hypothetical protein
MSADRFGSTLAATERRRRETREERSHRLDRAIANATYKARRAREGNGYRFEIPEKARAG